MFVAEAHPKAQRREGKSGQVFSLSTSDLLCGLSPLREVHFSTAMVPTPKILLIHDAECASRAERAEYAERADAIFLLAEDIGDF